MGSPLALVLANIFISFYESKWLNEYNLNKPKSYLRYVDDIQAAFDQEQDSLNFLNRGILTLNLPCKPISHSITFLDLFFYRYQ